MEGAVRIEGGFAEVDAGLWLASRGQPAAFSGSMARRRRKGWCVRDRSRLDLVETTGSAKCADSARPFLTHIPCAAPIYAVSEKVLVAPAAARAGAQLFKAIPMSARNSLCVTVFGQEASDDRQSTAPAWVVMATASRTARVQTGEGETLSVRPESVVAWTGRPPTGFCPRLSIWDVLLPRGAKDVLFTFYGPGIVWLEGYSAPSALRHAAFNGRRGGYGF